MDRHAADYDRYHAGPDIEDVTDAAAEATEHMRFKTEHIAARAGVCPTTVTISFCVAEPDEPWVVTIGLRKPVRGRRPKHANASGYGASIDQAAGKAIEDVAAWGSKGYSPTSAD